MDDEQTKAGFLDWFFWIIVYFFGIAVVVFGDSASAVQEKLVALSTIGKDSLDNGNVNVIKSGSVYTVTFQNDLGNKDVEQLVAHAFTGVDLTAILEADLTLGLSLGDVPEFFLDDPAMTAREKIDETGLNSRVNFGFLEADIVSGAIRLPGTSNALNVTFTAPERVTLNGVGRGHHGAGPHGANEEQAITITAAGGSFVLEFGGETQGQLTSVPMLPRFRRGWKRCLLSAPATSLLNQLRMDIELFYQRSMRTGCRETNR